MFTLLVEVWILGLRADIYCGRLLGKASAEILDGAMRRILDDLIRIWFLGGLVYGVIWIHENW